MRKFEIFFLIIGLMFFKTQACECSSNNVENHFVQKAYDESEAIVLATVSSIDGKRIVFSIIEYLKGNLRKRTIKTVMNSCSIYAEKDEMWLVYLEKNDGSYSTNHCLPNRNYGIYSSIEKPPPPPPKKVDSSSNPSNSLYKRHKEVLMANELTGLRQRKLLNKIDELNRFCTYLLYGVIFVLLILIAFFIIKSGKNNCKLPLFRTMLY